MQVTVEAIPALLHIAVFLFLTGLIISLFAIHHTVAYITLSATAVCFLAYAAITVMPVIYHDSPYTSPFSAPAWYISRKTAMAVLNAVDWVVSFLRRYNGRSASSGSAAPDMTASSRPRGDDDNDRSHKPLLSTKMTDAVYEAAKRPNPLRDAKALGWTLDQLDEEGELVKFAAGIPGFSHSTKVKESVAILDDTPAQSELYPHLDRDILVMLIRASKPGLLSDSKLLPESVREQREKICLEALYYLPGAMEDILKRVSNLEDKGDRKNLRRYSPVVGSLESWRVAERLSAATTKQVNPAVKIVGQCMAAVIASRPPLEKESLLILMRHLTIDDHALNQYLDPFDSLLLKNLNHFLENTALKVIRDADKQDQINIVLLTTRLLVKRLKFEHATQQLREEFKTLETQIKLLAEGREGKAKDNALELDRELSKLITDPSPSAPVASGNVAQTPESPPVPATSGNVAQTSESPPVPVTSGNVAQTSESFPVPVTSGNAAQTSQSRDFLWRNEELTGTAKMV